LFPILCVHGLSANRMAFDISEKVSFARYLSSKGFNVWIIEMRGSNMSFYENSHESKVKEWSMDDYMIDLKAAVDFILDHDKKQKLHFIGHSMGGILGMSLLSSGPDFFQKIASLTCLGSALSYHRSGSIYTKLLFAKRYPDKYPILKKYFIPHGIFSRFLASFVGEFGKGSPIEGFQLVATNTEISHQKKLFQFGFHQIPIKLLAQLVTAMDSQRGIKNENKSITYLDEIISFHSKFKNIFPNIYFVAGEKDVQCPPLAVENTINLLKSGGILDKLSMETLGKSFGHHDNYGHFDLLIGKKAEHEVFPKILDFILKNN